MLRKIFQFFRSISGLKNGHGVSSLEILVVNIAVIGLLVVFLHPNGPFARAFHETLSSSAYEIYKLGNKMELSTYNGGDPGSGPSTSGVAFSVWYGQVGGYNSGYGGGEGSNAGSGTGEPNGGGAARPGSGGGPGGPGAQ